MEKMIPDIKNMITALKAKRSAISDLTTGIPFWIEPKTAIL
jgi:hypothetical protein